MSPKAQTGTGQPRTGESDRQAADSELVRVSSERDRLLSVLRAVQSWAQSHSAHARFNEAKKTVTGIIAPVGDILHR